MGRSVHTGAVGRAAGRIVVFNGAPRSGKTSICRALQRRGPGDWVNLGVDASVRSLPERLQPGIGLRPGGERPDLEESVVLLYGALFEAVAAHARRGLDVAVDVGLHESYSTPLGVRSLCARQLQGLPVLFVGVRCPLEVIWRRRRESWGQDVTTVDDSLRAAVERWQDSVHASLDYDLAVDTSMLTPAQCADLIATRLADGPPGAAFGRLAGSGGA
jgi:chloramphenicol 3-O phosphotransferase